MEKEKLQTIEHYHYRGGERITYYEIFTINMAGERMFVGWIEPQIYETKIKYMYIPKKYLFGNIRLSKEFMNAVVKFINTLE